MLERAMLKHEKTVSRNVPSTSVHINILHYIKYCHICIKHNKKYEKSVIYLSYFSGHLLRFSLKKATRRLCLFSSFRYIVIWFQFPVSCTLQGIICQRTHVIYCAEAQPRSIFMCPRTNYPLQCTGDWELKLLVHTRSCISIGPELGSHQLGGI